MHSSLFALALVAACTVHHVVEDSNGPTGGGAEVARSLDLRLGEELVVGSGTHGALSTTEGEAVAHPFIGAAGATVGARIENAPQFARVGIRGPVLAGRSPEDAALVVAGAADAMGTLPADGVYVVVVEGVDPGGARYDVFLDCRSDECRVECSESQSCPDNARCFFVQCVTTPCPSYCQADLPSEPSPPVVSEPGEPCGSRGMAQCAARSFCNFPVDARCGEVDHPGQCAPVPRSCPNTNELVCACDGRTYVNACQAHMRGTSVRSLGACADAPLPVMVDDPSDPEPTDAESVPVGEGCMRTGCSSQICTEEGNPMNTTCEMRPEYACLNRARCERQTNGACGWTETPAFEACMDEL
ncbi:MAG: hypothetical protein JJ863_10595 [Deltaproteobacteria bacterium]|nr:hypothetical protein [Deltaproteobacteria bacterium]